MVTWEAIVDTPFFACASRVKVSGYWPAAKTGATEHVMTPRRIKKDERPALLGFRFGLFHIGEVKSIIPEGDVALASGGLFCRLLFLRARADQMRHRAAGILDELHRQLADAR